MRDSNKLYFGAAKEIITPNTSATMIGFATMFGVPFTDIHDDLYVRTLALRDESGETVILMSYDLLFHDDTLPEALREYIGEKYGISRNNLHVSYTHTHFGPAVKGYDFVWYTEEYEEFLLERAKSSIDRAIVSLRPGSIKYASVSGEWNISRRFVVEGDVEFKPSPDGECDKNLYLLRLDDETGKMRALLMNFACHPSNLSAYSALSSEYPGRLCQRIESEFYGCTALFFQGFGSDSKLRIGATSVERFTGISYEDCDEVALGMTQKIKIKMQSCDWQELPIKLGADVFKINLPLEPNSRDYYMETKLCYAKDEKDHYGPTPGCLNDASANIAKFHWARAEYVLDNYDKLPDYISLNCGVVRINPNFYIFSMGGEPGCNIATVLKESFADKEIVCFGYNDAIAYIPSDKMISEGGYEAGGRAIDEYRLKGELKPGVDELYRKGYSDAISRIESR